MAQLFADGARTKLSLGLDEVGAMGMYVEDGSRFPEITDPDDFFHVVVQDESGFEIIEVRGHALGVGANLFSNLHRGMGSDPARSFSAGATVGLRPTASDMNAAVNDRTPAVLSLDDEEPAFDLPLLGSVASLVQKVRNCLKWLNFVAVSHESRMDVLLDIPSHPKTELYTLQLSDRGAGIDTTAGVRIPAGVFSGGATIMVTNIGAAGVEIYCYDGPLYLAGSGLAGRLLLPPAAVVTLRKAAGTAWYAFGSDVGTGPAPPPMPV